MFGIPVHYEIEIAQYKVPHSWAVYYMTGRRDSRRERKLSQWIGRVANDLVVAKVIREVLFLYLERKSVKLFNSCHNERYYDDALPCFDNSYQAADFGLSRLSYPSDDDIIKAAGDLMSQMEDYEIVPFGTVDIPLVDNSDPDNNNLFFPVGMMPLFWGNPRQDRFGPFVATRFLGIVDLETGYTFATASNRYCLYTNREVYNLLLEITNRIFPSDEIVASHILLNRRGVCKMYARRAVQVYQPFIGDEWCAVVEAVNSYDKTEPLRYTFGFINRDFKLPLLMLDYTISVNTAHVVSFAKFRKRVLEIMRWESEMQEIEKTFRNRIESLMKLALSKWDMLSLFCKYFGISRIPEGDNERAKLIDTLRLVEESVQMETSRLGKTAYAMLHVIMTYLSHNKNALYSNDEIRLGKWVDDFIKSSSNPSFSISRYIGTDVYDVVSWYGRQ